MTREDDRPQRRSIRLAGYDYGQAGWYFITLCTHQRLCLFGEIVGGETCLNAMGQIVNEEWAYIGLLRPRVILGDYVIMPNHLHAIVVIDDRRTSPTHPSPQTLGSIVRGVKGAATSRLRTACRNPDLRVWQRNYYEHVIRDDRDLQRIRTYIANNPMQWTEDENNPTRIAQGQSSNTRAAVGDRTWAIWDTGAWDGQGVSGGPRAQARAHALAPPGANAPLRGHA